MHLFHSWSKWTQFKRYYTYVPKIRGGWAYGMLDYEHQYQVHEEWERRHCFDCGKNQERRIEGSPKV